MGTEEVKILKANLIDAYRNTGFNLGQACRELGIERSTVVNWQKTDSEFDETMKQMKEEIKDLVEASLLAKVAQGDTNAIIYASRVLLSGPECRGYDESPKNINARVDVVHSKEEIDAIVAASHTSPELLNTPAMKQLLEKTGEIIEAEIDEE